MKSQRLVLGLAALIVLTGTGVARAYYLHGWSDGSTKIRTDPSSANTMLQGFEFEFEAGWFENDNNIERIGVLSNYPSANTTFIQFRDEEADDDYDYFVSQTPITVSGAVIGTAVIDNSANDPNCRDRGRCAIALTRPGAGYVFALRGFLARYRNGDHRIRRIAVTESNGTLTFALYDRNYDDPMHFEVEYVWLPPAAVRETGSSAGSGPGYQSVRVPSGVRVISGFDLNYVSGDHDMKAIQVSGDDTGLLDVNFADQGEDNAFGWRVNWTILR